MERKRKAKAGFLRWLRDKVYGPRQRKRLDKTARALRDVDICSAVVEGRTSPKRTAEIYKLSPSRVRQIVRAGLAAQVFPGKIRDSLQVHDNASEGGA